MNVEFTYRHMEASAKLKAQAEAGLERVAKLVDRSASAHVILSEEKYRKCAEVTVKTSHGDLVAKCEDKDLEQALHDALQKVEQQAVKNKARFETVSRHPKAEVAEAV